MSEAQILGQFLQGRTLVKTAEILGVARSTVKTPLGTIYRKSQANRQAELSSHILKQGGTFATGVGA